MIQVEDMTMRTFVDEIREQGEAMGYTKGEAAGYSRGESVGRSNGVFEGVFGVIMNVMQTHNWKFEDALKFLVSDESEREVYRRMYRESQKS